MFIVLCFSWCEHFSFHRFSACKGYFGKRGEGENNASHLFWFASSGQNSQSLELSSAEYVASSCDKFTMIVHGWCQNSLAPAYRSLCELGWMARAQLYCPLNVDNINVSSADWSECFGSRPKQKWVCIGPVVVVQQPSAVVGGKL